jgi:hypothetical protein
MKTYFQIQYRRLLRGIQAFGVPPLAGIAAIVIGFPALTALLFARTTYAPYLYTGFALMSLVPLGAAERNNFLRTLFAPKQYQQVRLTENLLLAAPFCTMLLIYRQPLATLAVLVISIAFSRFNQLRHSARVIPTPFSRQPFEFTTGFRRQWWVIIIAYVLTGIGLYVGNYNLSLFALALLLLQSMGFYSQPEPEFYVWVYARQPQQLLLAKMKTALYHTLILSMPAALFIAGFYPQQAWITGLLLLAGALNILMSVVVKYSAYPAQPGLPQLISMAAGLLCPPLLLLLIPYYFKRAVAQLNPYLT